MTDHSQKDWVSIIGFGSLLSEESARRTCPNLRNFRRGRVDDFARVFCKVDPNSARFDHDHIANWAFVEMKEQSTLVTLFEIPGREYPDLAKREGEYDLREVPYVEEATGAEGKGVACCAFDCNDDFLNMLENNQMLYDHYMKTTYPLYQGPIWRKDILPRSRYVAFCLNAAKMQGAEYVNNILDHSFLADEKTTIREYLTPRYKTLEHIQDVEWLGDFLKKSEAA